MVIVKKFTTFRPNNLKINEPRQMYSEHKNAGKGRLMLTFKELRQQILHSSRLTHGKTTLHIGNYLGGIIYLYCVIKQSVSAVLKATDAAG